MEHAQCEKRERENRTGHSTERTRTQAVFEVA